MGGQVWKPKVDEAAELQKAKEAENQRWRLQSYMQSVTPGGASGRVIDWNQMR
jgi:hypothetical protein